MNCSELFLHMLTVLQIYVIFKHLVNTHVPVNVELERHIDTFICMHCVCAWQCVGVKLLPRAWRFNNMQSYKQKMAKANSQSCAEAVFPV